MMNSIRFLAILVCTILVPACAGAQDTDPPQGAPAADAAVHEELRAIRLALTEALKKGDVEGQLAHVHDNVVATWQNGRVVRGHEGLKKFLAEMTEGNKKVFKGYKVPPEADELTILYGDDTGIVFGRSVPQYNYLGMEFDLENRWTATLVKDEGAWKIAAYHVSANVVDNPVLNTAKRSAYWAAGIALLVGLALGAGGCRLMRRK
jgi:ketosteroid isomerase-like protein